MPLSPHIRQLLLDRLSVVEAQKIELTGPDLRCATVEDAEQVVIRFTAWLGVFSDLSNTCALEEDCKVLVELYDTFHDLVADLKVAIHATRNLGVPWEETRGLTAGTVAARNITGTGVIDPSITTFNDHPEGN